jgi:hypothetical protein
MQDISSHPENALAWPRRQQHRADPLPNLSSGASWGTGGLIDPCQATCSTATGAYRQQSANPSDYTNQRMLSVLPLEPSSQQATINGVNCRWFPAPATPRKCTSQRKRFRAEGLMRSGTSVSDSRISPRTSQPPQRPLRGPVQAFSDRPSAVNDQSWPIAEWRVRGAEHADGDIGGLSRFARRSRPR